MIIGIKLKYKYQHRLALDVIRVVTPLARLLKENNVFMSFIVNVRNAEQNDIPLNPELITYVDLYSLIKHAVDYAFTWDCTKEGYAMWKDINTKWTYKFTTLNNIDKYIKKLIDEVQKKYNARTKSY